MVIFHSYVKLPEGKPFADDIDGENDDFPLPAWTTRNGRVRPTHFVTFLGIRRIRKSIAIL